MLNMCLKRLKKKLNNLVYLITTDELVTAIKQIDVMNLTPMDAMNQLYELKKLVDSLSM